MSKNVAEHVANTKTQGRGGRRP